MNERETIGNVIQEASKAHEAVEIIVVSNGTTDGSDRIAEKMGVKVIRYERPLGHDVGRKEGAAVAKGKILLFLDGDIVIPATQLQTFVQAIEGGSDVALNGFSGSTSRPNVHPVVLAKHAVNAFLSRSDLKGSSMTAIPHAISRRALEVIGLDALAIPPLAHTIAIKRGLKVKVAQIVEVGRRNRVRTRQPDPLEKMIVADNLYAMRWLVEQAGKRGGFTDLNRRRELVR
ncbi:glycosyltransferase family 2 protein [Paenibacillus sp. 481]|nr:glycosyltransferase family 2 protein [Paenibacillus sp. 481]